MKGDSVRFPIFAPLSTLAQSACVRGAMIIVIDCRLLPSHLGNAQASLDIALGLASVCANLLNPFDRLRAGWNNNARMSITIDS